MNVRHLIRKEIAYRRLNFGLSVLAVTVAVGCLVGAMTLLEAHDYRSRRALAALEDDVRKITKALGYNVLIIHEDQDLRRFYRDHVASVLLPETHVERLAGSGVVTVRHLLPTLRADVGWPERDYPVILIGTRDEVPPAHRDPKKPLVQPVPPGTMVLGSRVAADLGLAEGDEVTFMGEGFRVGKVHPRRDGEDDFTVWIHLHQAQELLDRPGRVSAILALSCICPEAEGGGIEREIRRVLDDVQVVILTPREAARRRARARAAALTTEVRGHRQALAAWIVPVVIVGCGVWVGLMALGNVRERRGEIGILRALGLGGRQVLAIFLGRALVVGLVGAAVGFALGYAVGGAWGAAEAEGAGAVPLGALFRPGLLAATLVLAPLLAAVASLVPALLAAQEDPAVVLRQE